MNLFQTSLLLGFLYLIFYTNWSNNTYTVYEKYCWSDLTKDYKSIENCQRKDIKVIKNTFKVFPAEQLVIQKNNIGVLLKHRWCDVFDKENWSCRYKEKDYFNAFALYDGHYINSRKNETHEVISNFEYYFLHFIEYPTLYNKQQ